MIRSTNRHSFPFDKRPPKMPAQFTKVINLGLGKYATMKFGYNTVARQIVKKLHRKKQRQHNRKLEQET